MPSAKKTIRTAFRICLYVMGVALAIPLLVEGLLRLHDAVLLSKAQSENVENRGEFRRQIEEQWLNVNQKDRFLPPYLVYSDAGSEDVNRLKAIFSTTQQPPGLSTSSWDFLQGPGRADQTSYTIHINSLGFRGPEYSKEKAKGVYRIIALGSYHVFGHGVNDNESYPAQLEKRLNELDPKNKYEVWNGGRHAGTAIIALARMKFEILNYNPDLLILDYGYVDPLVWSDNFMISALRLPDGRTMAMVKSWLLPVIPLLSRSRLYTAILERITVFNYRHNIENFITVMSSILKLAHENGIPVILVRQLPARVPIEVYREMVGPDVSLVNVRRVFANKLGTATVNYQGGMHFKQFLLNPLQLNPRGQEVLANALANVIIKRR